MPGSNSKQYISEREKRRNLQANNRPKTGQQLYSLSKIQNGIPKKSAKSTSKRGLHGKNRPKGRLFLRTPKSKIKKIRKILVGRGHIRVSMPNVRTGSGPKNIHETYENPHFNVTETKDPSYHLHGRHADNGMLLGGNHTGKGHDLTPPGSPGFCNQLQKIGVGPIQIPGVSGNDSRQRINVLTNSTAKNRKSIKIMFKDNRTPQSVFKKNGKDNRETKIDSASFLVGPSPNKTPSTGSYPRNEEWTHVRNASLCLPEGHHRAAVVDQESRTPQREIDNDGSSGPMHHYRCSEGSEGGLGSWLSGFTYRGTLDKRRERSPHKRTRTSSGGNWPSNVSERQEGPLGAPETGQYNSPQLPEEDGRNQERTNDRYNEKNLVFPIEEEHLDDVGVHPIRTEYDSGLGVSQLGRFQRMVSPPVDLQHHQQTMGGTRYGLVCLPNIPPNREIHELETGPIKLGNGRSKSGLEQLVPIRFSPFLPNWQGPEESQKTPHFHDNNHSHMGISTMVPNVVGNVHQNTPNPTELGKSPPEPEEKHTPSDREQDATLGGMVDLRTSRPTTKISSTASSLIKNSKARGTRKNYESSWRQFNSWCGSRKIDPVSCPVNCILDYLGSLFDDKKEYSSLNGHRSALSAYHDPIDGFKVGQHPLVCDLMKGVSNLRPPQPRYRYIWDVEKVIQKMRDMPHNNSLTLKQLSYKVITLLGLCAIKRSGELSALSTKWISFFGDKTICAFGIKGKTSAPGKVASPITFHSFPENDKVCPVKCLGDYILRTRAFRLANNTHGVFLSVNKPHKPITRARLTKWVLKMLHVSGIDTNLFKAHSMRSASSSKVANLGLPLKDILENGNWSGDSTWQKFYHKRVSTASMRYQETLLSKPKQALKED